LTADVKELAAVKSPTDFFTAQSALLRKSFDAAVANASKNTEAMMKLANEVITPLSSRVTVAVEKVSKAA
jgi:phasin family protein